MATSYATTEDIAALWRTLTTAETTKAGLLIPIASSIIFKKGESVGIDTDELYSTDQDYASLLKLTTVNMVARALSKDTSAPPMSQFTQSALDYSYTGTVIAPGQDLYLLKNEAKVLGINAKPKIGGFEPYELDPNNNSTTSD